MILYKSLISENQRIMLGLLILNTINYLQINKFNAYMQIDNLFILVCLTNFLWIISVYATNKYTHKYPQRYLTYSLAKDLKALTIVVVISLIIYLTGIIGKEIFKEIIRIFIVFSGFDFLLDMIKVADINKDINAQVETLLFNQNSKSTNDINKFVSGVTINILKFIDDYKNKVSTAALDLIRNNINNDNITNNDKVLVFEKKIKENPNDLLLGNHLVICNSRLNNVVRLNNTLRSMVENLILGGYLIVNYTPMEIELEKLKKESSKISYPFKYTLNCIIYRWLLKITWLSKLYFSKPFAFIDSFREKYTSGKRRYLSRAEIWGRLVYFGLEIIEETTDDGTAYVIAKKITEPSKNKIPTYHTVVTLEKVGLFGSIIRLHKIRSMYPFSEFLQKDLYKKNGLTNTGKFKNDFRLTDYGPFIRKYWIDEIPGIIDWLRGDIKLVGMRATSPHYLSLYPKDVIRKYMQVKPGLIPPIFDEKTTGFDQIVEIENRYLERYLGNPIKTDIEYFWYTFRDIFIRKVRSK